MPDEDEKTTIEPGGEEIKPEKDIAPPKSGGGNKIFLMAGIGLGAVVVGIALTIFVIKPMMSGSGDAADNESETVQVDKSHSEEKKVKPKKESNSHSKKQNAETESNIFMMKDIVINPAGTGGSRFLSVSFGFEIESSASLALFEEKEPVIRDALITILSSKTVAQLTDPKQKEIIRYQIKKRVSKLMDTDELAGVYYTDFVLQ